jgi:DNA processing protein
MKLDEPIPADHAGDPAGTATFSRLPTHRQDGLARTLADPGGVTDAGEGQFTARTDKEDDIAYKQMFVGAPEPSRMLRERATVLALMAAIKRETHRLSAMIEAVGGANRILEGHREGLEPWEVPLAAQLASSVSDDDVRRYEAMVVELQARGVQVLTVVDDDYPLNLRLVHNGPPALFVKGEVSPSRRAVAIVGTRHPRPEGLGCAIEFSGSLAARGIVVVSGLARGIDAGAHRAAIDAGGRTLAVMGTGIDHVYPPEHAELAAAIVRQGSLVSQFWPVTPPTRHTFPLRNATLSGLAAGVVVVEGSARSGSSMQARIAFEQGRPVFFVMGLSAEEDWAKRHLEQGLGRVVRFPAEVADAIEHLTQPADRVTVT